METIYSNPIEPNVDDPLQVLAFVLVRPQVFCSPTDDAETLDSITRFLDAAKADFVRQWYERAQRRS